MTEINVYSIYDIKAMVYNKPFNIANHALAIRGFADAVSQDKSMLSEHPEDFQLFHLGTFNEHTGKYTNRLNPEPISNALEHAKPKSTGLNAAGEFFNNIDKNVPQKTPAPIKVYPDVIENHAPELR